MFISCVCATCHPDCWEGFSKCELSRMQDLLTGPSRSFGYTSYVGTGESGCDGIPSKQKGYCRIIDRELAKTHMKTGGALLSVQLLSRKQTSGPNRQGASNDPTGP